MASDPASEVARVVILKEVIHIARITGTYAKCRRSSLIASRCLYQSICARDEKGSILNLMKYRSRVFDFSCTRITEGINVKGSKSGLMKPYTKA